MIIDRKCIPLQIILLNSSTMKTRLLILAMVFMPIIAGCSKDKSYEKLIVGNWFLSSLESPSVDRPEESVKIEFTAETAEAFMSFTADGEFSTVSKNGDYFDETEIIGTYYISDGKLIMNTSSGGGVVDIEFDGNDHFYMLIYSDGPFGTECIKQGMSRM